MADAEIVQIEPTDDDPVVINPLNDKPMQKLKIGPVQIDRCEETGAIWLDRGELAQLATLGAQYKKMLKELDQPNPEATRRARRGPIKSPRTGEVMMVVNDPSQKHIEFEVDPSGGGCFFDAGELADLTEYSFGERLRSFFG